MDVRLPDGTVIKNVPDGISKADLVTKLKANGMNVPDSWSQPAAGAAAPQSAFDRLLGTAKGLGENALSAASGAVAQPVAGIAGLGQMANNALGIGAQQDPSKTVEDTQNALTYSPKTAQGQALQQSIGKVTAPVGRFIGNQMDQYGQNMSDATGSPLVGALAKGALGALPQALGTKLPELGAGNIAAGEQAAVNAAPRAAQVSQALDAGYKLPPTTTGIAAPGGKLLTGVGGKTQIDQNFAVANQHVTNNLAKTDLGIPSDVPFDSAAIAKVRANANEAYDKIKQADRSQVPVKSSNGVALTGPDGAPLTKPAGPVVPDAQYISDVKAIGADRANATFGTPIDKVVQELQATLDKPSIPTSDLVNQIKTLRQDARTNLNAYDDVSKQALGRAQQQGADALEGQLGRYLQQTSQPGLLKLYQQARTTLAKAHTIDDAMDASGNVDAAKINQYRNGGGYVDGNLKTIADAADSFKDVVRNTQGVKRNAPFSAFDSSLQAAALTGGGSAAAGHVGAGVGLAGAGLVASRPLIRDLLESNSYQRQLAPKNYAAGRLSQLAANPASPLAALAVSPEQQEQ